MHVELVPSRREAVTSSWGRRSVERGGREVRPGHGDGVVDVQVAQEAWRGIWIGAEPRDTKKLAGSAEQRLVLIMDNIIINMNRSEDDDFEQY